MEYKDTLNLPRTDFPMKADLPNREPGFIKSWEDSGLYQKIRVNRKGKKKYILHDGPPYANGSIHMGHALNKLLKDMVIRYQTMRGFDSPYVPGWDCHGLPVEHQLFKELKMTKYDIDQVSFRGKAHDYALRYVDTQRREFKRLGIMGRWEDPYLTLSKYYEASIVRSFGKLVEKGYIYKDLKPVNWCPVCETALAEAEVEYEDKTSPSIYVKFELAGVKPSTVNCQLSTNDKVSFVIWTTTPWTLVANVAIAVHPDVEYALVDAGKDNYVMAKTLVESSMEKFGIKDYKISKTFKGKELAALEAKHPFIDRNSRVVTAEYVSMEDGTGCVHTAPGHGQDDFATGKRYGLPVIMPVDPKGKFDKTAGDLAGIKIHEANKIILEKLKLSGHLIKEEEIRHSYPHCWRCKKPIIFRATEQYFLKIDHDGLRKHMLEAISSKIKWVPEIGRSRISSMLTNRPDWCLSRQRYWGVPIIAFYCKACKEVLLSPKVIAHVASMVETDGADVWFKKSEKELLPAGMVCAKCGAADFTKETDILDVWFDSGVSHQAVLKREKDLDYPCELYLEGSDQHRGWFQSSLITGMAMDDHAPYRKVLTHGFVVDGDGRKMSKSTGNVITPEQVMKKYGADILRLWVASSDYSEDIRISDEILTRLADAYRKMRNTYKYLLSNLYDFDPSCDSVKYKDMLDIDRWILSRLSMLVKECEDNYNSFSFHKVYRDVYNFCTYEISSVYLDILKDRMYTFKSDSAERRSGQTAMFEILSALARIMAPILPVTTDEAWRHLKDPGKKESVHLEDWPEDNHKNRFDEELNKKWGVLISVREEVLKKLEEKRSAGDIGSSLEARITLSVPDVSVRSILEEYKGMLRYLFIASEVGFSEENSGSSIGITINKAEGSKCQRCWNYSRLVGGNTEHPTLCERCVGAVKA